MHGEAPRRTDCSCRHVSVGAPQSSYPHVPMVRPLLCVAAAACHRARKGPSTQLHSKLRSSVAPAPSGSGLSSTWKFVSFVDAQLSSTSMGSGVDYGLSWPRICGRSTAPAQDGPSPLSLQTPVVAITGVEALAQTLWQLRRGAPSVAGSAAVSEPPAVAASGLFSERPRRGTPQSMLLSGLSLAHREQRSRSGCG